MLLASTPFATHIPATSITGQLLTHTAVTKAVSKVDNRVYLKNVFFGYFFGYFVVSTNFKQNDQTHPLYLQSTYTMVRQRWTRELPWLTQCIESTDAWVVGGWVRDRRLPY